MAPVPTTRTLILSSLALKQMTPRPPFALFSIST